MNKVIVTFIVVILILLAASSCWGGYIIYLKKSYINFNLYFKSCEEKEKFLGIKGIGNGTDVYNIPNILFQTTQDKNNIPQYLLDTYTKGYKRIIFDDNDCESFINKFYGENVLNAFKKLRGAHKADLARYCFLYIYGGVYLDIKTLLIKDLDKVFKSFEDKPTWYTVISIVTLGRKRTIYQGIIASYPRNPIFLDLILFILKRHPPRYYLEYTYNMARLVEKTYNFKLQKPGTFEKDNTRLILLQERCKCKAGEKRDRYGLCCQAYFCKDEEPSFKVRDPYYKKGRFKHK